MTVRTGCLQPAVLLLLLLFLLSELLLFTEAETAEKYLAIQIDECRKPLGVTSGDVVDSQMTSSSSYDENNTGPQNARVDVDRAGGAWCPRPQIYPGVIEYLQVDLGQSRMVTSVLTQGRYGQGRGMEYTEAYSLQYWRPEIGWTNYTLWDGQSVLPGNTDVNTVHENALYPTMVAHRVRFIPHSSHPRTVCLRVELLGCSRPDGLVSYSMRDGDDFDSDIPMTDLTYDGKKRTQYLGRGLGQLTDGVLGSADSTADLGHGKGYEWIGWTNNSTEQYPVEITFAFDTVHNFSSIQIHTNIDQRRGIQVFAMARAFVSLDGRLYDGHPQLLYPPTTGKSPHNQLMQLPMAGRAAKFIKLQLFHRLSWLLISEVQFITDPCVNQCSSWAGSSSLKHGKSLPIPHNDVWRARPQDLHKIISSREGGNKRHQLRDQLSQSQLQLAVGLGSCLVLLVLSLAAAAIYWWSHRRKADLLTYTTFTGPLGDRKVTISMKVSTISVDITNTQKGVSDKISLRPFSHHLVRAKPSTAFNGMDNPAVTTANQLETSSAPSCSPTTRLLHQSPQTPSAVYRDHLSPPTRHSTTPTVVGSIYQPDGRGPRSSTLTPASRPLVLRGGTLDRRGQGDEGAEEMEDVSVRAGVGDRWRSLANSARKASSVNGLGLAGERPQFASSQSMSSSDISESTSADTRPVTRSKRPPPKRSISPPSSPRTLTSGSLSTTSAGSGRSSGPAANVSPMHRKRHRSRRDIDNCKDSLVVLMERCFGKEINHVTGSELTLLERLGEGEYGELLMCSLDGKDEISPVIVKCIQQDLSQEQRRQLCGDLSDLAAVSVSDLVCGPVAICDRPLALLIRHSALGDLNHYLQRHLSETSNSRGDILTFAQLLDMAQQIADGMRFIHSKGVLHKDLATRNCVVFDDGRIRISDTASGRDLFSSDYCHLDEQIRLPVRWLAWEVLFTGEFSKASDVWAFGVTLWEMMTYAREMPFEMYTDEQVVVNLGHFSRNSTSRPPAVLQKPVSCSSAVYQLMLSTWSRDSQLRPAFSDICQQLRHIQLN